MSKEPLWTDAKIKALTVLAANTVDPQARWMHEQIAKDMRNDYERALASRNEQISRLQGELRNMQARIAGLENELTIERLHNHELAAAIICCICDKPIEGDDLDGRFWLHEQGCQFVQTGECGCDLECHAACYAGHEDEYAPLFDDEDDEGEPLFDDFGFDEEPDIDDLGDDEDDE